MIDVIVVEDDVNKLSDICNLIYGLNDLIHVEKCVDLISAKKAIKDNQFDLMVLDISIPNRIGTNPLSDGGLIFLKEIKERAELYNKPIFIVGLTSYAELKKEYQNAFTNESYLLLQYAPDGIWKQPLSSFINRAIELSERNRILNESEFDYDLAIVTALCEPEFKHVLRLTNTWEIHKLPNDPTTFYTGVFKKADGEKIRVVSACTPQVGLTANALLSTKLIYNFRPQYFAICGIAAGFKDRSDIGDILVAEHCWEYNMGKITEGPKKQLEFHPDPRPINLDPHLRDKLLNIKPGYLNQIYQAWPALKPSNIPNVVVGPMCSGSFVLAAEQILKSIEDHDRKVIGLDMETYAMFYSALNSSSPKPKVFSVKSVCDFGTISKDNTWQSYAAFVSAKFLYKFVCENL